MIVNLVMAIDFAAMTQESSDPLAYVAMFATMAMMILAVHMLLLLHLARDDGIDPFRSRDRM
jgi:hypothetical protein